MLRVRHIAVSFRAIRADRDGGVPQAICVRRKSSCRKCDLRSRFGINVVHRYDTLIVRLIRITVSVRVW